MAKIERCPACVGRPKVWYNHQKKRILKTKPKNLNQGFVYFELICIHCKGNGLSFKGKESKGLMLYREVGNTLVYQA